MSADLLRRAAAELRYAGLCGPPVTLALADLLDGSARAIQRVAEAGGQVDAADVYAVARAVLREPAADGAACAESAELLTLTRTERRIANLLPTNLSIPEISRELYVSVNTIKTHLKHIYRKLGVGRRSDAVQMLRKGVR